jgi:ATPase subunit of ABC transporter with duplicated ATPase domains
MFRPDDIVIAVMGITGVGKSTFISHLTDEEVVIGRGLASCESIRVAVAIAAQATRANQDQAPQMLTYSNAAPRDIQSFTLLTLLGLMTQRSQMRRSSEN